MRRIGIVALVLLGLLGISQLVIPPIIESRISDRLTAAGGAVRARRRGRGVVYLCEHDDAGQNKDIVERKGAERSPSPATWATRRSARRR